MIDRFQSLLAPVVTALCLTSYYRACNIQENQGQQHSAFSVYTITEYADGGDLLSLLQSNHPLGWHIRMRIMKDALAGLQYLHSKSLIHRDLKSSNLLLDRQWRCKIADFGMVSEPALQPSLLS